jgi:3-deoxy-D-manno-octulosonic-acid transferase
LLEAHTEVLRQQPDALLVLAPRYPARGPDIEALAPAPGIRRRAAGQAPDADTTVYVADTVGEMGLWYRLACVAFVGGSLAPVGGHNPFEPLALGCAVLHGPQVGNFEESYAALDAQGLALKVSDAQGIATAVEAAWAADRAQQHARWQACPLQTQARAMVQDLVRMAR